MVKADITLSQYNIIKAELEKEIQNWNRPDWIKKVSVRYRNGKLSGLETALYIVQTHIEKETR